MQLQHVQKYKLGVREDMVECGPLDDAVSIKPKARQLLKFLLGPIFFAWMVHSGRVNVHEIVGAFSHWAAILAMLVLLFIQPAITAWRWNLLLRAQDIRLPYKQAFSLTMIGLLVNVAIPGAIGGDLLKGYYVTREIANRRSSVATSILMDRVIGILGLFLLAAMMIASNFRELALSPVMSRLGEIVAAGSIIGLFALYAAVWALPRFPGLAHLPKIVRNTFRSLYDYHKQASIIPIALAASLFSHLLPCVAYYIALSSMGRAADVPTAYFFLLVPLGFVATAVPISPAGIGVGQVAFFALFRIVSALHARAAADAFTVYQVALILVSLSGFYWYVSHKTGATNVAVPIAR